MNTSFPGMKKRRPRRTALFHACYFLVESSRSHWVTVQKMCVFNGFGVVPYECVDHAILLKRLYHMGVKDRRVLQIIKAMLKAGVMDACKDNEEGTPQGGLISPLLANVYLDMMDEWITK